MSRTKLISELSVNSYFHLSEEKELYQIVRKRTDLVTAINVETETRVNFSLNQQVNPLSFGHILIMSLRLLRSKKEPV